MTEPSKVTRFWIPTHFKYTRLSEESVEAVLASDYDALCAELRAARDACAEQRTKIDYLMACVQNRDNALKAANKAAMEDMRDAAIEQSWKDQQGDDHGTY